MLEKADTKRARRGSKARVRVWVVEEGRAQVRPDTLATEEPMEIHLDSIMHVYSRLGRESRGTGKDMRLIRALIYLSVCISTLVFLAPMEKASAHENDGDGIIVHVTDEGFEPRSVEVGLGETVVFENSGQKAHWPASDDHPTHLKYPEFDPLKPLEPKTEWSFTFDKPGDWKYHDHQNPYLKGEIVVREDSGAPGDDGENGKEPKSGGFLASIQTFFLNAYRAIFSVSAAEESPDAAGEDRAESEEVTSDEEGAGELSHERYEEIKDNYLALVRDEDPGVALGQLRDEIETNDALARSCHDLVHEIGHEAYNKYGDFSEAMKYQDEICNSGYLHGIIESRFSESDDPFAIMQTMCDEYPQSSFLSWQCYHGIGHGLMYYTANDLPRSLEMCDAFGSSLAQIDCSNGVFMENFAADQKLHLSEFLKESDPFYPCAEQADRHKTACYLYAPTYFLSLHKGDYAGALEWCGGAEDSFKEACARGVGSQTMKENIKDPEFAESVCTRGSPEQGEPCVEGMVSLYINHYGSLEPARELCGRLKASNQQTCYDSVESNSVLFRS
jgi:plastocyanin